MSVVQDSMIVSPQFNNTPYQKFGPTYKFVRINMSNILSNQVPVTATSTANVHFKLPPGTAYNLSRSRFNCSIVVPQPALNTTINMVADTNFFAAASFETGNGLQLMNIPNDCAKYCKVLSKVNTKTNDYLSRDVTDLMYPSNSGTNPTSNTVLQNEAQDVAYLETLYLNQSAANTAKTFQVSYELSNLADTYCSLDKESYFGNNDMYLKLTIDAVDKWLYQCLTTGPTNATLAAPITGGVLTDVYLYLAVETNIDAIEKIRNKFNGEGLKILTSYPVLTRLTAAGTSQNIVVPFVPANGHHLKRIYHTVWNGTETVASSTYLDNSNSVCTATINVKVQGSKIQSYNTYLDSTKLQDDLVDCTKIDPWRINKSICDDTCIINRAVYMKNFFHCDNFETLKDGSELGVPEQNVIVGMPMDRAFNWQLLSTCVSATYIHLNIGVFQRTILINKDGVQFV